MCLCRHAGLLMLVHAHIMIRTRACLSMCEITCTYTPSPTYTSSPTYAPSPTFAIARSLTHAPAREMLALCLYTFSNVLIILLELILIKYTYMCVCMCVCVCVCIVYVLPMFAYLLAWEHVLSQIAYTHALMLIPPS